ncbi:CbrC family protein [Campylobacter concisus]|uniref:CbrC family protein n=1 Tax=Campylobacter concisus TaxID=199 RepID=A0A7S9NG19_9BACT|nr:CbrC family protein [Campylobacter concisus]QPH85099.1 CbrC family protein [Campylobacter concisus]
MNKFQEKYITLSKEYYKNNGNASSIEALYQFKEELENCDDIHAKYVLVDVYQLLSMRKSAYDLLLKIHDKSDKKQLKALGYLVQFIDENDKWVLPRPKSRDQILAQKDKAITLPKFIYHPDPLKTGAFKDDMSIVCECCGKNTEVYYNGSIYCKQDISYLCPTCISSGMAAKKFDATFVQDADKLTTNDTKKDDELFKSTPGYESWQGEHWVACCDDYCAFLGDIGTKELEELGIADEVFEDYAKRDEYDVNIAREMLVAGGDLAGYLFRCLHCKKYHIYIDAC